MRNINNFLTINELVIGWEVIEISTTHKKDLDLFRSGVVEWIGLGCVDNNYIYTTKEEILHLLMSKVNEARFNEDFDIDDLIIRPIPMVTLKLLDGQKYTWHNAVFSRIK